MNRNPVSADVLDVISNRWSPYRFEPREIENEKLIQCFEAARWAASSFNDQPWSWIIAKREDNDEFQRALSCLLEANQAWAKNAGALIFTVIRPSFAYNQKPNRVALHDLGQAACQLSLQAVALGLQAHQMAGVNLSRVRAEYGIPDEHQPETAIAIGYPDSSEPTNDEAKDFHQRDSGDRQRHPLNKQLYSGKWGSSASLSR